MAKDGGRTDIQKKTFTRWVNTHLADRNLKIDDLAIDLADGIMLINLLEIISTKRIKKWNKKPRMHIQKLENLNKALDFIKKEGLTIVNIGANDIYGGNIKIILGLIWTLILRYQINKGNDDGGADNSVKKELLKWVNKQISPYDESVKNFTSDWSNPKILNALTDSLQSGLCDPSKVSGSDGDEDTRTKDIGDAMEKAERHFAIPQVMDANDMASCPDDLSVMTYVSYYRDKAEELARKQNVAGGKHYAEGPGLETGINNHVDPREFTVFTLDGEGNPVPPEDVECEVTIRDPDGGEVKNDVSLLGSDIPGSHVVKYRPNKPGKYVIDVKINGVSIKGMPKEVLIKGGACGEKIQSCEFAFTIHARNDQGVLETEGGDLFEVDLKDEKGEVIDVKTKDNGDGTYTAKYKLTQGHLYTCNANLNGEAIANSPFTHDMRSHIDDEGY